MLICVRLPSGHPFALGVRNSPHRGGGSHRVHAHCFIDDAVQKRQLHQIVLIQHTRGWRIRCCAAVDVCAYVCVCAQATSKQEYVASSSFAGGKIPKCAQVQHSPWSSPACQSSQCTLDWMSGFVASMNKHLWCGCRHRDENDSCTFFVAVTCQCPLLD